MLIIEPFGNTLRALLHELEMSMLRRQYQISNSCNKARCVFPNGSICYSMLTMNYLDEKYSRISCFHDSSLPGKIENFTYLLGRLYIAAVFLKMLNIKSISYLHVFNTIKRKITW